MLLHVINVYNSIIVPHSYRYLLLLMLLLGVISPIRINRLYVKYHYMLFGTLTARACLCGYANALGACICMYGYSCVRVFVCSPIPTITMTVCTLFYLSYRSCSGAPFDIIVILHSYFTLYPS